MTSLAFFPALLCVLVLVVIAIRQRTVELRTGVRAQGTIVALETQGLRLLDYYPVVRFRTPQGKWLTLRSQTSGRAQGWKVGQKVEIRYPASAPECFTVVSGFDFLID